jgi:hypothetical protein
LLAWQQAIKTLLIDSDRKRKTLGSRPDFPAGEQNLTLRGDPAPAEQDFT